MRILAVDDEEFALIALQNAIEKAIPNAFVSAYNSVASALEVAKTTKFDVVFTDIHMPVLNGIDFAMALKRLNPYTNIIFVTGYDEYMQQAIDLHASGYILKPVSANDVYNKVNNLLYPVETEKKAVVIRTFGDFEVFVHGKPVNFVHAKSKEILAYMVDRNGAKISKRQIVDTIYGQNTYNLTRQNYVSKLIRCIAEDLEKAGAKDVIQLGFGHYSVNMDNVDCDYADFLKGDIDAINKFHGEYMQQYGWAQESKSRFWNPNKQF